MYRRPDVPDDLRHRLTRAVGLRVAVWYAGVFLVSSAAIGLIAYWLLATSLARRDHELLRVKLAEYADRYERGGLAAVSDAVAVEQASGSPDSVMVRLVGRGADVQFFSVPSGWRSFDFTRLDGVRPSDGDGDEWDAVPSASARSEVRLEVVSRPLWDGSILQVGRTTLERDRLLGQVRNLLGVLLAMVLGAGLAGGVALTRSALRPLRELRNTVRAIAQTGRLDARVAVEPQHGDVVDELGRLFNAMLARIETLVDGMRDALDNVAHDLRTPIARLRARAEAALAASSADPAASREALAACVDEADRVIALLTTLMDISEAETGTMRLSPEPVSVREVVDEATDLYEDLAEDRGVILASAVADGLTVQADRQRLRQVLANLVDNALKYTPAGGRVEIGGERTGTEVTITVRDTGAGIAPADLPRIWDRLYRGHAAREHGLGLGLSLVRAIVAAHGGRVDVDSEPGRGSTFRIVLPAAA